MTSLREDYDNIFIEIGGKGDLSRANCRNSARAFVAARRRYPKAKIMFTVGGYDDDPREIYDIPEAREFIRQWAELVGLSDWRDAMKVPWEGNLSLGVLQLCGCFAADSPITVNTPTGVRK